MSGSIKLSPSGITFFAEDGVSVLESALNSDVCVSHSCLVGNCNECEARLLKGVVKSLTGEVIDTNDLDPVLMCQVVPYGDCEIEIEYFPELSKIKKCVIPAKVNTISFPSPDIAVVNFRLPPKAEFNYVPGQYLDLMFGGVKRSYSIANSPGTSFGIELHIRRVPDGAMSDRVFSQFKENTLVRFSGPVGTFFLRQSQNDIIFLATGTGFSPIKAMVENLISSGDQRKIYIYWGGRFKDDIYSNLPSLWSTQCDHIFFSPILSRENPDWDGRIGYVQDAVLEDFKSLAGKDVYACGSSSMIRDSRKAFEVVGLKRKNFYSDAFVASTN